MLVISTDNDQVLETYNMHTDTITAISSYSEDNLLISGSKSGEVIVWKISKEYKLTVRQTYNDHEKTVGVDVVKYFLCIIEDNASV